MLRLTIHSGVHEERTEAKRLAWLDIAYARRDVHADYVTALFLAGHGEITPQLITSYPRWSANVWDLVGRALSVCLYATETVPALRPAPRSAFADQICGHLQVVAPDGRMGQSIGSFEFYRVGRSRTAYAGWIEDDLTGRRDIQDLAYRATRFNAADFVARALGTALNGEPQFGARPSLVEPDLVEIDGASYVEVAALPEPAKSGLRRHWAYGMGRPMRPDGSPAVKLGEFVRFLAGA